MIIPMTNERPLKIDRDEWTEHVNRGEFEESCDWCICVLQRCHNEFIVFGHHDSAIMRGTHAGHTAMSWATVIAAIHTVADAINRPQMADDVISELPPVKI